MSDFSKKMADRGQAAAEVFEACLHNSESFEDKTEIQLGTNLAYLMGSILKGAKFQAWLTMHEGFIHFLVGNLSLDAPAWNYIELMGDTRPLSESVKLDVLHNRDVHEPAAVLWIDAIYPEQEAYVH